MKHVSGRLALVRIFILWYLLCAFALRIIFLLLERTQLSGSVFDIFKTFAVGAFFDIGTLAILLVLPVLYLVLIPNRFIGSLTDRILIWGFSALMVFIIIFTFFAEVTFWEEFHSRFNFIAVDYLIYTHEVVANIQESYPLPLLIIGVLSLTVVVTLIFVRYKGYERVFTSSFSLKSRLTTLLVFLAMSGGYIGWVDNHMAEWSPNRYNSEISKSGIYSFFAAFRNNQMKFPEFYTHIKDAAAFEIVRYKLSEENARFEQSGRSIFRNISALSEPELNKNVVFILLESFSGDFMQSLGSEKQITPFLDSLAGESIFFRNIYATGTRTVRGMEAVTLCMPPTPGQSIVKRPNNAGLYTISNVFAARQYKCNFFYGGDGYFDNMNAYFGGNGFDIYDRGHGSFLADDIKAKRNQITDAEVKFENAWGICDEDIYEKVVEVADKQSRIGKRFFNFVMTTSNHRPYTYPEGCIDLPSGKSREGAVKYTDHALEEFFKTAKTKSWYDDTVFIIIADHCASSAGKNEIDVANYRIPAFIVNMPGLPNQSVNKLCSQIDLFPTFFSLANWNYRSNFFGKNVFDPKFEERAFIATYRKLGLMKGNKVMVLSDQRKNNFYDWDSKANSLTPKPIDSAFLLETISFYQTADYLFTNGKLK